MAIGEASFVIGVDLPALVRSLRKSRAKFVEAIKSMQEKAKEAAKKMGDSIGKAIKRGVQIGVAALAVLGAALALTVRDALADIEQTVRLEKVIRATGKAAGFTAKELVEMAEALQDVTTFDNTDIKTAQTLIATFTNIIGDQFPLAVKATLDLAAAMGINLKQAALQVGKALSGPRVGLTALRRVGVLFTNTQKEMVVAMFEAGKVAESQNAIFQILRENGIDGNADAATNASDQFKLFKNVLSDITVAIGKTILEMIGLSGATTTVTDDLKEFRKEVRKGLQTEGIVRTKETINDIANVIKVVGISVTGVAKALKILFDLGSAGFKGLFDITIAWNDFLLTQVSRNIISLGKIMVAMAKGDFVAAGKIAQDALIRIKQTGLDTSDSILTSMVKMGKAGNKALTDIADLGEDVQKSLDNLGPDFKPLAAAAKVAKKDADAADIAAEKKTAAEEDFLQKFKNELNTRKILAGFSKKDLEEAKSLLKVEKAKNREKQASIGFVGIEAASRQASINAIQAFNDREKATRRKKLDHLKDIIKARKEEVKAAKKGIVQFIKEGKEAAKAAGKPAKKETLQDRLQAIIKDSTGTQKETLRVQENILTENKKQATALIKIAEKPAIGVFGR